MFRRAGSVPAAALALAFGLVLAGCSSDDSSGGDETASSEAPATTTTAAPVVQRGEDVASPEVTGPIEGDPFLATDVIEGTGYVEEEFFLEGEATAYEADGRLAGDGQWTVTPGESAPYRTRILVRYPEDPEAFDGTVFVEWFNVTGGIDVDVAFGLGYPAIIDAGSAYVGVSAQEVGIEGGASIEIEGAPDISGIQEVDPERYGRPRSPR